MLRTTQLLPLTRAFDTGLRPRGFPHEAASLLPGLLTATRTGLTPASDDELTTKDHLNTVTSSLLVARNAQANLTYSNRNPIEQLGLIDLHAARRVKVLRIAVAEIGHPLDP